MSREKLPRERITMSNEVLVTNPKELQQYLLKSKNSIALAMPGHLNPDRMCRLAVTAFSTTPALRECTPQSILASIIVAAQLGLEPGVTGQAYLVPYKKTCTLIPGWQGLVGLLNNTGRATAWTGSVFDGDEWDFELGSQPKCKHRPGKNYGDSDKLIWVYACGKVNGSEQPVIEAWPISRVLKHRDRYNKVGAKHYSYNNIEMYARKVVLLQVLKYMPRSVELNGAILATEAAEMGRTTHVDQGAGLSRDEGIIEVDAETDDKFDTRKADPPKATENAGATQTGAQQSISTAPDEDAAETQREIEESKRKAADLAAAKAAEAEKAKAALKTDKPKAPPWDSAKDKPSLLAWLAREGITQAQVCGYVKSKFAGFDDCMTIDAVEALATKPLANILFKFDAIKAEIAAMPGKSAV